MKIAREKEATELSEALVRQINRTARYQGNLHQSQIINGIAIAFFTILFIKARDKRVKPD